MQIEIELPRTLYTYSSYFDTLSVVHYLESEETDIYANKLSGLLGKNVSSVSDQIKGHLAEHNLVEIKTEGRTRFVTPNRVELTNIFAAWYSQYLERKIQKHIELEKSVTLYNQRDSYEEDIRELCEPDDLARNKILALYISHILSVYGESVCEFEGKNRGYLANELDWSIRSFLDQSLSILSYIDMEFRNNVLHEEFDKQVKEDQRIDAESDAQVDPALTTELLEKARENAYSEHSDLEKLNHFTTQVSLIEDDMVSTVFKQLTTQKMGL